MITKVPEPVCTNIKVRDPGVDIAVYDSIVAPPLLAGAEKTNVAVVLPVAAALTIEGVPGTVTPLATVIDIVAVLELVAFVAVTV